MEPWIWEIVTTLVKNKIYSQLCCCCPACVEVRPEFSYFSASALLLCSIAGSLHSDIALEMKLTAAEKK